MAATTVAEKIAEIERKQKFNNIFCVIQKLLLSLQ